VGVIDDSMWVYSQRWIFLLNVAALVININILFSPRQQVLAKECRSLFTRMSELYKEEEHMLRMSNRTERSSSPKAMSS
jgi:hypothetical protein